MFLIFEVFGILIDFFKNGNIFNIFFVIFYLLVSFLVIIMFKLVGDKLVMIWGIMNLEGKRNVDGGRYI